MAIKMGFIKSERAIDHWFVGRTDNGQLSIECTFHLGLCAFEEGIHHAER